jgi:hypothetical protein
MSALARFLASNDGTSPTRAQPRRVQTPRSFRSGNDTVPSQSHSRAVTPFSPIRFSPMSSGRRMRQSSLQRSSSYLPMPTCGQRRRRDDDDNANANNANADNADADDVFGTSHLPSISPRSMKRRKLTALSVCEIYNLAEGTLDNFAQVYFFSSDSACLSDLFFKLSIEDKLIHFMGYLMSLEAKQQTDEMTELLTSAAFKVCIIPSHIGTCIQPL